MDETEYLDLKEDLLEAVRDLWEARCSRKSYAARGPEERYAAPFKSFGVTAAKHRVYALCEELWGSSFDNGPVPSAASGRPDEPGWENE